MISYRDTTFCTFYKDCAKAKDCPRPLTPEVMAQALAWGNGEQLHLARWQWRHQDCIQPADQTAPMLFLYETSAVSKQMKTAVEAALEARLQESKK
jgi:hypothetical protein